jgi:hypothetical protein
MDGLPCLDPVWVTGAAQAEVDIVHSDNPDAPGVPQACNERNSTLRHTASWQHGEREECSCPLTGAFEMGDPFYRPEISSEYIRVFHFLSID